MARLYQEKGALWRSLIHSACIAVYFSNSASSRLNLDALRGRPGAGFVAVRGEQHVVGEAPALDDFGCNRDDKAKAAGRPASNSTGRSPQSGKMKKSRMYE